MMCDPATRSFRSQLSAVLERLTKAALQEIAGLADECSSVLHTEISLHRTENEALKKRCYSLEVQLRAAREAHVFPGHLGGGGGRRQPAGTEPLKVDHQPQLHPLPPPPQVAPAIDGVFGKDWCLDLWREDKRGPAHRKDAMELPAMSNMAGGQVLDLMDREPDLIFVKEETYDDHPIGQQMSLTESQKGVAMFEDGMLHRSISELQLHHSEELSGFAVDGQLRPQLPPPSIMDKLIDDAAMSSLVDNVAPPPTASAAAATAGEYLDYTHASPPARSAKAGKQFACLFCGKVFNYLSSLKVHIRRHSGEKPFSCAVCGKRFAQKTYLKLHQRVHSGEKPYSCPDCGKSFSQKSSLNIHLRTHTGEKPYSCVDCGKCYAYKYGLNHHQCFT